MQADPVNILHALTLITLCVYRLDFVKFLMDAQVVLDRAPVLTFGSVRLSFSWISVFPHPPPSGRQRPFLWLAPLSRFSAFSAAVHWASLSSHIKDELFVTPFRGVLGFSPLPITSY